MPDFPIVDTHLHVWDHGRLTCSDCRGDYPLCLQVITLPSWIAVLDRAFADLGFSIADTRKIYRDNASAFYRLGLNVDMA